MWGSTVMTNTWNPAGIQMVNTALASQAYPTTEVLSNISLFCSWLLTHMADHHRFCHNHQWSTSFTIFFRFFLRFSEMSNQSLRITNSIISYILFNNYALKIKLKSLFNFMKLSDPQPFASLGNVCDFLILWWSNSRFLCVMSQDMNPQVSSLTK